MFIDSQTEREPLAEDQVLDPGVDTFHSWSVNPLPGHLPKKDSLTEQTVPNKNCG